jgi:hypothetical protein
METTRSEREKKFCPGSARGGRGFHVCVRVSLLEAEPAEIVEPGAPFEKWKRFFVISSFQFLSPHDYSSLFSMLSSSSICLCIFFTFYQSSNSPNKPWRDHQETDGNWSELRSYPAKLYYQIDKINQNHQQKKDKGRRLIMRNVFLPPKKNNPSLPEYNEWKNKSCYRSQFLFFGVKKILGCVFFVTLFFPQEISNTHTQKGVFVWKDGKLDHFFFLLSFTFSSSFVLAGLGLNCRNSAGLLSYRSQPLTFFTN